VNLMKYLIKLNILFALNFLVFGCSSTKKQLINGKIVSDKYAYNANGFVNSPFGKVAIKTHSYYKKSKLVKTLLNKPEGFLEYTIEDLKKDTLLINYLKIDTIFSKKRICLIQKKRNDTIFCKNSKNNISVIIDNF